MSFVKTLATLAVGFAAARGYDKYRKIGGMDGVKEMMKTAGDPGGMVDQMGAQAEKLGLPGGAQTVRGMFEKIGGATETAEAGLGGLIASMTSAAATATAAGGKMMEDMMGAMTGAAPISAMSEENAKLMIRAMIQAAKADGEIDAEERQKILDHLNDASEAELAFVEAELAAPVDVQALVSATGDAMKAQIYATSVMAIRVDSPLETAYLDQLAAGLGLDAETRARLDASMGNVVPKT